MTRTSKADSSAFSGIIVRERPDSHNYGFALAWLSFTPVTAQVVETLLYFTGNFDLLP